MQDFTLETKCACPYKSGQSCSNNGGGGGGGGGGESGSSNSDSEPGVVGIVLLCL